MPREVQYFAINSRHAWMPHHSVKGRRGSFRWTCAEAGDVLRCRRIMLIEVLRLGGSLYNTTICLMLRAIRRW